MLSDTGWCRRHIGVPSSATERALASSKTTRCSRDWQPATILAGQPPSKPARPGRPPRPAGLGWAASCMFLAKVSAGAATIGFGSDISNPLGAMKSSTIATAIDARTVVVLVRCLIISRATFQEQKARDTAPHGPCRRLGADAAGEAKRTKSLAGLLLLSHDEKHQQSTGNSEVSNSYSRRRLASPGAVAARIPRRNRSESNPSVAAPAATVQRRMLAPNQRL